VCSGRYDGNKLLISTAKECRRSLQKAISHVREEKIDCRCELKENPQGKVKKKSDIDFVIN